MENTKELAIERLEDILNGGELNTLNDFFNGFDIKEIEMVEAQSYLQGIFKGFKEFNNISEKEATDIFDSLNIKLENNKKERKTTEIIFF